MTLRRLVIALVALASAAVAAVAAGIGLSRPSAPVLSDGSIAALERPGRSADALPARVLELPFARHFANPNAARLVSRDVERSVYVVPGRDATVCLVVVEAEASGIALNCAARSLLRSGSVWQGTRTADGAVDIVGVVGDGVTYATADGKTRLPVRGNVFAMSGVRNRTIILGTESGVEAAFDLGDLAPPE
jgi:hypothetical protein